MYSGCMSIKRPADSSICSFLDIFDPSSNIFYDFLSFGNWNILLCFAFNFSKLSNLLKLSILSLMIYFSTFLSLLKLSGSILSSFSSIFFISNMISFSKLRLSYFSCLILSSLSYFKFFSLVIYCVDFLYFIFYYIFGLPRFGGWICTLCNF